MTNCGVRLYVKEELACLKSKVLAKVQYLGHTHYILRLTDPDRGIPGVSERKK